MLCTGTPRWQRASGAFRFQGTSNQPAAQTALLEPLMGLSYVGKRERVRLSQCEPALRHKRGQPRNATPSARTA
jgi:hypothetical protein